MDHRIRNRLCRRDGRLRSGACTSLVAPRGETEWTRNLRAAGWGELMRGRRIERVRAVEVEGRERQRALRAYLRRYGWLTRRLFDLPPGALRGEDLRRIAPQHAVFRLAPG